MKRFVFLLLALSLLAVVLPVAAQSTLDPAALAVYFPQNTPAYVSFRTDDGYIAALEAVRAHFNAVLPDPAMGDETLYDALDQLGPMTGSGETFAEAVRPWLGDSGAVGALSLDSMMGNGGDGPFLIALSVTDRAGAQAFFESLMPAGMADVEETAAYTLITPTNTREPGAIYIDDQVLLITNKPDVLPINGTPNPSLADNADFQASQSALPAGSYNIAAYVDYSALLQASMADMQAMSQMPGMGEMAQSNAMMEEMLEGMLQAIGGMGVGFTILDDQALTVDVTLGINPIAFGEMMSDMSDFPAFDPAFAQYLPSGTQLAIQGTNLSASVEMGLANLSTIAGLQSGMDGSAQGDPGAAIEFALQGTTGLDLQDDILSWMSGQYAIGLSLDFEAIMEAAFSGDVPPRALQFAFVAENTSGEGAQALVAGLGQGLMQLALMAREEGMTITQTTAGGQPAVEVSLQSPDMREPFELLIGGNDSVFVIGTPAMATAALSPDGSLNGDAGYQESVAWALPNSPVFLYGSGDFLNTFLEVAMLGRMMNDSVSGLEFGEVFSSTSGSGSYGDTSVATRLILALGQE
jgi:hypothetical protein